MALPKLATPKYELQIPSTGESVNYRPYLVKEEKVLMLAIESKDQSQMITALKDVISGCTEGKIKPDKLTLFDLEYIFLKLRSKSVGENSTIGIKCTECSTSNEIVVDLEQVQVRGDFKESENIKLTDDVGIVLKYPNVKSFQRSIVKGKNKAEADQVMSTIASMIDSIYEGEEIFSAENETEQGLVDFLESLTSDQFKKITEFMMDIPKLSHTVEFDCTSCKAQNTLEIEGLQSFF